MEQPAATPAVASLAGEVLALLRQPNIEAIRAGLALARERGAAELFDHLLRGVRWTHDPDLPPGIGRLVPNEHFDGPGEQRAWLQQALIGLVSSAPPGSQVAAEIRLRTPGLALGGRGPGQTHDLADLRFLEGFHSLLRLDISGCESLRSLRGIESLPNLRLLNASGCRELRDLAGIRTLKQLSHLDLSYCRSLISLRGLAALPALQVLVLESCSSL